MKTKGIFLYFALILLFEANGYSQTFERPNCALKSHETLIINKIELSIEKTLVYLSVENRIPGGYFCADKNISIIYPDGSHENMTSSRGIPVCPATYKFKTVGEKLDFVLEFPPLKKGTRWIDLVENCAENCFSFYGVLLDDDLNKRIDEAFALAEKSENNQALAAFINLANSADPQFDGARGLFYISIIRLAKETGNSVKAAEWYNRLKSSNVPRLELYLKNLNSQGIIY